MTVTIILNNVPDEMYRRIAEIMSRQVLKEAGHIVEITNKFEFDYLRIPRQSQEEFLAQALATKAWLDGNKLLGDIQN